MPSHDLPSGSTARLDIRMGSAVGGESGVLFVTVPSLIRV